MSETFDPDHRWLGMSTKHQPPGSYGRLALARFGNDAEASCI